MDGLSNIPLATAGPELGGTIERQDVSIPVQAQWLDTIACRTCRKATPQVVAFRDDVASRFATKCRMCDSWNVMNAVWRWLG